MGTPFVIPAPLASETRGPLLLFLRSAAGSVADDGLDGAAPAGVPARALRGRHDRGECAVEPPEPAEALPIRPHPGPVPREPGRPQRRGLLHNGPLHRSIE